MQNVWVEWVSGWIPLRLLRLLERLAVLTKNKTTATNTNSKKIQNDFNTFCFTDELHWVICLDEDSLVGDWNGSAKRSRAPQIIRMLMIMIDRYLVSEHHHVSSCIGIFSFFLPCLDLGPKFEKFDNLKKMVAFSGGTSTLRWTIW